MLRLRLLITLFCVSCVHLPRSFHALTYRNQTVYLDRHHYYKVGFLPEGWKLTKGKGPGIIFRDQNSKATIATEALCGRAFEDISLSLLTDHLFAGLKDVKKIKSDSWQLSNREALYTEARANLDGVSVQINVVVIKKNQCQFDFLTTSRPEFGAQTREDFLNFVKGFDY